MGILTYIKNIAYNIALSGYQADRHTLPPVPTTTKSNDNVQAEGMYDPNLHNVRGQLWGADSNLMSGSSADAAWSRHTKSVDIRTEVHITDKEAKELKRRKQPTDRAILVKPLWLQGDLTAKEISRLLSHRHGQKIKGFGVTNVKQCCAAFTSALSEGSRKP